MHVRKQYEHDPHGISSTTICIHAWLSPGIRCPALGWLYGDGICASVPNGRNPGDLERPSRQNMASTLFGLGSEHDSGRVRAYGMLFVCRGPWVHVWPWYRPVSWCRIHAQALSVDAGHTGKWWGEMAGSSHVAQCRNTSSAIDLWL